MARLYEDARIIPNEGGTRHYPITMRVFEAVGAGALLVTDDLPGTDLIFQPGRHYAILGPDIAAQAKALLGDLDGMQRMADAALAHGLAHHTYDHRVDELFEIADKTDKREIAPATARSELGTLVDRDAEVQRVAHVGAPQLEEELADRQVFDAHTLEAHRLAPGKMETVAVRADDIAGLEEILRGARRFIYVDGPGRGLDEWLSVEHPRAVVHRADGLVKVDLMAESYRVHPHEVVEDTPRP
jgi:hypothetical protein